jgi:Uncharacterized protein conserved in bacteria (DUF2188)
MAREQYFIIVENNEWKISFNGEHYGPYPNQQQAIEAAIDAAYAMGEIGINAQVLIQDADHKFQSKWLYEKDFNLYGR